MSNTYLFLVEAGFSKTKSADDSIKIPQESPEQKFSSHATLHTNYPFILYDWSDVRDQRISVKIWLPSGVQAHEVKARVQTGGWQVNVFTKMPSELINTEAHRLTYQDDYGRPFFSKTDVRIVSHANAVAKLKSEANDEEIWTVMKINLPFQVEERFFSDGSITGYHLARVNDKLMMFLELIGVRSSFKAQYKGKGFQNIGFVLSPEGAQDQGNLCGNDANTPAQQPQQENEQTMHETILRKIQDQFRLQQLELERMRKEREEEKKFWNQFRPQMGVKQDVFVSSPLKKSTASRSANIGASNSKKASKNSNQNQENLKDPFATGNTTFDDSNMTPKANKKVSPDQNQQQITDLITFANFDANSPNKRQRIGPF